MVQDLRQPAFAAPGPLHKIRGSFGRRTDTYVVAYAYTSWYELREYSNAFFRPWPTRRDFARHC